MRLNLWPLPLLILTKRLLLQRKRSNMMTFHLALEANNLGRILDLFLALLLENGLVLVIGGFLHTQQFVKCGLYHMTLLQAFLQRSDLGLELFHFLYMVSIGTSTRGSRCINVERAFSKSLVFCVLINIYIEGIY